MHGGVEVEVAADAGVSSDSGNARGEFSADGALAPIHRINVSGNTGEQHVVGDNARSYETFERCCRHNTHL